MEYFEYVLQKEALYMQCAWHLVPAPVYYTKMLMTVRALTRIIFT